MINLLSRNYNVWRVHDISLIVINKMIQNKHKLHVAPATMIKVFGPPSFYEMIVGTTGVYNFEDSNLDLFKILDRNQTKEWIKPKLLKLKSPPYSHRGKSENLPTTEEFWKSTNPAEFWLQSTDYADIDNFKKWFDEKLAKNEDFMEKITAKFGPAETWDDYKKNYEISRDYALFRYNKYKWD